MSVKFDAVSFHNKNSIDTTVAIEAPIGTTVVPGTVVPMKTTVKIPVNRENCVSVAIIANDGSHEERQTFEVNRPATGTGVPAYLVSVELEYSIGTFKGGFTAHTS